MENYWFVEHETGEEFFVQAKSRTEAFEIAKGLEWEDVEPDLECYGVVSDETADYMGLDTY